MAMVDQDPPSPFIITQPTGGFTARVRWLGLKVGSRLVLPNIRQMNSGSNFVTMSDSTINIVWVLLLLLLLLFCYY